MSRYSLNELITDSRMAMGRIDIIPTYLSDGLSVPWNGKIFLQLPNWKKEGTGWVDKAISEYQNENASEIIILATARSETKGFQKLSGSDDTIYCGVYGRMNLSGVKSGATLPSVVFHIGKKHRDFIKVLEPRGAFYRKMERQI